MKSKLKAHPIANLFPMMERPDLVKMAGNIRLVGQIEPGVVKDGLLLDGRNRQSACNIADVEFKTIKWEDLPKEQREGGPVGYVMSRNFFRRQLSKGQKAIIAAKSIPLLEAEAAERSKANLKQFQQTSAAVARSEATAPEPPPVKRGRGRPRKNPLPTPGDLMPPAPDKEAASGKTAARVAKQVGVSPRMVESARALLKKDPKKAAEVESGKTTLAKATKDVTAADRKKAELEDAFIRIGKVCGKNLEQAARDGRRLRGRKEVMAFVAMTDEDMKRCQGLIESNWSVKRARLFRAKALTPKHRLEDLINRAAHAGGTFELQLSGFTLRATRDKG